MQTYKEIASVLQQRPTLVACYYIPGYEGEGEQLSVGVRNEGDWLVDLHPVCRFEFKRILALANPDEVHYLLNDESTSPGTFYAAMQRPLTCTVSDALDFINTEIDNSGALGYVEVTIGTANWRVKK